MKRFVLKVLVSLFAIFLVGGVLWYIFNLNPSLRFGTDRAAVITQIQSLSRLETASFTIPLRKSKPAYTKPCTKNISNNELRNPN